MARRQSRKKKSQAEIDQEWIDQHGSLQWARGVIVKTVDGYKFECAGRTMSLPHKDTMTKLKLAATLASDEIERINRWNRVPAQA